jgi:hypothetical protein
MLIYNTHRMIHLSIGTTSRWLRWALVESALMGVMFWLALPWGPQGLAVVWVVSFGLFFVPAFWFAGKPIRFGAVPVLQAVWKYCFASLLSGTATLYIMHAFSLSPTSDHPYDAAVRIAVTSLLFASLYVAAVILLHAGYAPFSQLARHLRQLTVRTTT